MSKNITLPLSKLLRIGHINAQSIKNKIAEIEKIIYQQQLDILCITEACVKQNQVTPSITNYKSIKLEANESNRGIVVCIKNEIKALEITIKNEKMSDNVELLVLKCQVGYNKSIYVATLYRHPVYQSNTLKADYECIEGIAKNMLEFKQNFFILGDFNLRSTYINKLNDIITNLNLTQLVDKPTRNQYLLDLIICNNKSRIISHQVKEVHLADHKLVQCDYLLNKPKEEKKYIKFRSYKKVKSQDIEPFLSVEHTPNQANNINFPTFILSIKKAFDTIAPVIEKRIRPKENVCYVSPETKYKMKERDIAYKYYKKHPCIESKLRYFTLKKYVKRLILLDTKNETISQIKQRGLWAVLNKREDTGTINIKPNEINDFFVNISSPICSNGILMLPVKPLQLNSTNEEFYVGMLDVNDTINAWNAIKNKKSTSIDTMGLTPYMIDLCMNTKKFPFQMTSLFNSFITSSYIPREMKCARVVPIPKIKNPSSPNFLRPISIQPILLKIFEKCLVKKLSGFIETENILSPYQFGFRRNHSTIHALIHITDNIRLALDQNEICIVIALDFKKAFDKVVRKIILEKLKWYNINDNIFKTLLEERTQFVSVNDSNSDVKENLMGVPQGSSVSNILFSIMINDLPIEIQNCNVAMFADDTSLMIKGKVENVNRLVEMINSDLARLQMWLEVNKLELNVDKTEYMICGKDSQIERCKNIELVICGEPLRQVNKLKILGVIIDNKLDFTDHTNKVSQKMYYALSKVKNVKHFINIKYREILANACLLPIINYACLVWFYGNQTYQNKINKMYRSVARYVLDLRKYEPTLHKMCNELKWLTCTNKLKYELAKLCFNISNKDCPRSFLKYMNDEICVTKSTRKKTYEIPNVKIKTKYGEYSFGYQCNKIWANIPINVKTIPNVKNKKKYFNQKVLEHLLNVQSDELYVIPTDVCNLSCIDHVAGYISENE